MTDQDRVYVTTCSEKISLKTQTESDSDQVGHIEETYWEKKFVIVAPDHPEVTPRIWATMSQKTWSVWLSNHTVSKP